MNIGGISIEMAADLARLRQDMNEAKASVGGAMEGIGKAVDLAKAAFVAYLGVASVQAFKSMVMGAVEATGALHDLSKQTGNSAAALAQFRSIGQYSETTIDAISAASLKLSKNMAMADEEGKGAAVALKALGINFGEFQKQSPDERMLTAAKALAQYKDGADKSAAAMLLFGKEGAKLLPFLGDLAEQSDEVSKALEGQGVETKRLQAAMADTFGDNLTKISKQSNEWKKDLSMGLLPAMYEASEAFLQMNNGAGGLKAQISQLAKDGTLAEWARGAMTALSYLLDVGQGLFTLIPMLGKAIAGVAAGAVELFSNLADAQSKLVTGDFSGAFESMKSGFRSVATIGADTAEEISKLWNQKLIGQTFRETMDGLKGVQAAGKATGTEMDRLGTVLDKLAAAEKAKAEASKRATEEQKKHTAAVQAAQKAGLELTRALDLKNDQLQLEVDLGRKLTPIEQENLKLTRDLQTGKVKLTEAQEKAARAAIEHGAALEREIAWMQQSRKENQAAIDATDKRIDTIRAETEKQRESNAELLLSTKQVGDLRQAKLLDLAASAERKAALMDEVDWTGQLGEQQRELAKAYRESAAVAADGSAVKAAKEAQDAWQRTTDSIGQGLTDSLFRAFESGKGFFKTLWDGIVNTFKTTALKLVISGSDGKGGIVGTIMDAVGMGSSSSGGSGGGGLSSLGSWASTLSSMYKYGSTMLGGLFGGGAAAAGTYTSGAGATYAMTSAEAAALYGNAGYGAAMGSSGAAGGASAGSFGWAGPVAAIIAGMMASGAAFSQGFNQDNMPDHVDLWAPQHRFDTNLAAGIVGDKWANMFSGAALTSKLLQWGAGTPHRGGMYVSDGTNGYVPGMGYVGNMAAGDSVGKNKSAEIESALKSLTGGAAGILNEFSKMFGGTGGYSVGGYFASDNSDPSQGNTKIWRGAAELASSSGYYADNANEGYAEFTKALAGQVRKVMDTVDLPDWVDKELKGLSASATFEDIAKFISGLEAIRTTLKSLDTAFMPLGGVFARIADLSDDATIQLAQFAGGIDKLMAKTATFVELYYSDSEKHALQAADLLKSLQAAGITGAGGLSSKDDFKALVMSADVQTEAAQKQLLALLDLSQAFAPVGDYLKEQGLTLADLAAQAPAVTALQALTDAQSTGQAAQLTATETLNTSVIGIGEQISVGIEALGNQLAERLTAVEVAVAANGRTVSDALTYEGVPR